MEEFLGHVLKAVTVLCAVGVVKLRDMILGNRREILSLQKEVEDLKKHRANDLIEQKSLIGLGTSIDTKIELKLNEVITAINEQRHKDSQAFTTALHELKETLIKMNSTLDHMKGDVDNLKRKK